MKRGYTVLNNDDLALSYRLPGAAGPVYQLLLSRKRMRDKTMSKGELMDACARSEKPVRLALAELEERALAHEARPGRWQAGPYDFARALTAILTAFSPALSTAILAALTREEPVQHEPEGTPKEVEVKGKVVLHPSTRISRERPVPAGREGLKAEEPVPSQVVPFDRPTARVQSPEPEQAQAVPPPASEAERLLDGFFAAPMLRAGQNRRHHATYQARRAFWLELHDPAFVAAVIKHAMFGEGVRRDCFGAVCTWLDNPAAAREVPAIAALLDERTRERREANQAQAPQPGVTGPGQYLTPSGLIARVTEVYDGIAVIDGDPEPVRLTRTTGWRPVQNGGTA